MPTLLLPTEKNLIILGKEGPEELINDLKNFIYDHCISPDKSKFCVTLGKNIFVSEIETSRQLCILVGHTTLVKSVCYTVDGSRIISGSIDGIINVWNAANGNLLQTLQGHAAEVNIVCCSLDDKMIISSDIYGQIKIWNTENYELIRTLQKERLSFLLVTPDSKRLVMVGNGSKEIKILDLGDDSMRTLAGHQDSITYVFVSELILISCDYRGVIVKWDVSDHESSKQNLLGYRTLGEFVPCGYEISNRTQIVTDGTKIISYSNGKIQQWDMDGKLIADIAVYQKHIMGIHLI